jgi:hypothetical protein
LSTPRAFISFDFDNNQTEKTLFAGQATTDSPTPFTVADWSSKTTLPQGQWKALVKAKMAQTNMCIVLVGRWTASATGVAAEIAMASELDVPVLGVYVGGAIANSALPVGLLRSRTVPWTWPEVAVAVDRAMTEGKNR